MRNAFGVDVQVSAVRLWMSSLEGGGRGRADIGNLVVGMGVVVVVRRERAER